MGWLLPWLAVVAAGTLVAVALILLGLRDSIRAAALGYSVVLLAAYLPIALRSGWVPSLADILPTMVISVWFAMPGIVLSVLGAAFLHRRGAAWRAAHRLMSIAVGVALGTLGGFLVWSGVSRVRGTMFPWWAALILGAGAGACWGILAPSVIRPNKPLQPTSGGRAEGRGAARG